MKNNLEDKYDAIIVGAGIGGLVCGCYLAKAGIKVLIIEKNDHPGGCCTSFLRQGFRFDSAAHSLGGMSDSGPLGNILKDLDISRKTLVQSNLSYVLQVNNYQLPISNILIQTLKKLQKDFPKEKSNLKRFFDFIQNASQFELIKLRSVAFKELLGQYFKSEKLKSIVAMPLLGNIGVNPFIASAFTSVKFYKQYVLDGGYHFKGGMQELPDLLLEKFKMMGGQVCLSTTVDKIIVDKKTAVGVYFDKKVISAKFVISNVDSQQTFFQLIGKKYLPDNIRERLLSMKVSSSLYAVYIGLYKKLQSSHKAGVTYWYINRYNLDQIYQDLKDDKRRFDWVAFRIHPGRKTVQLFTLALFENDEYWKKNNVIWRKELLQSIKRHIPNLSESIILLESATPQSIYRWTFNSNGATCGWASIPSQFALPDIAQTTFISNLFLTGHWTTITLGIPGVAAIGKSTANLIIKKAKNIQPKVG